MNGHGGRTGWLGACESGGPAGTGNEPASATPAVATSGVPAPDGPAPNGPAADGTALRVTGLSVHVGGVPLVREVSLTLGPGERVGLIGESGCGKSLTALAILGLLPEGLRATGSVRLAGTGHDLLGAGERRMSRIRGRRLAMVFQEPMTALNPTMRVGRQVAEVMRIHRTAPDGRAALAAAVRLLDRVGLPDPPRIARAYPHQISGGQRQRVVLAMALANSPAVLLCDEPTTALDVLVQAQILDVIRSGVAETGSSLLFITHDLGVVATICERVLVMYGGRVVESGPVREVFRRPRHPYTYGLLAASDLDAPASGGQMPRLRTIPGTVPTAGHFPAGCPFRNRCPRASEVCADMPGWSFEDGHGVACWHPIPDDRP